MSRKTTEENIQSTLQEDRLFAPSAEFSQQAFIKSREELDALRAKAEADHEGFWAELARTELDWQIPFTTVLDESKVPHYVWFSKGKLNLSYNCLDRHLAERGDKTAIVFEGEQGDTRHISYSELHRDVCQFANGLKSLGVGPGDRVILYMPMTPESVVAMQACAHIGATHSVVFGGFSAESLKDRIENAGAKLVITADGAHRGGKIVELKAATDEAVSNGCASIEKVIVLKRTGHDVAFSDAHDIWWHDLVDGQAETCEPVWVGSEHPLFLLYTSGSTGRPKGIQHSTTGRCSMASCM